MMALTGMLYNWYNKFIFPIFGTSKMNVFMKNVIAGKCALDFEKTEFYQLVKARVSGLEFRQQVLCSPSYLATIILFYKRFPKDHFKRTLDHLEIMFMKDEKLASALKLKGDVFANNLDLKKALRCYNLAAKFAPVGTQCLGRIYASRALLFSRMKKREDCVRNVNLATRLICAVQMKSILLTIKENLVDKNEEPESESLESVMQLQNHRDKNIFKVQGNKNPKMPSAIAGLRISNNQIMGRYLTTDCSLKPGTTVIVEDPYVAIPNNSTKWDTDHCSNCLKKTYTTIPCETCVFVSYCSEECRLQDLNNGHQFECKCYPYLHAIRLSPTFHLGLKAICKEGPENLFRRWKESTINKNTNDLTGFDPDTGVYDSNSYHQLLYLKSHIDFKTYPTIAWIAVSIAKILDLKTDFFKKSEEFKSLDFKLFIASLFLLHGTTFSINVVSLNEDVEIEIDGEESQKEAVETFSAVYSLISLMCHSCDATVFRQNLPNGRMAIITNRQLQPGDEISLSYGLGFMTDKIVARRKDLLDQFHFNCQCVPCSLKWPPYAEIDDDRKYLCPNCKDKDNGSSITQSALLLDENNLGFCSNCNNWLYIGGVTKEVDRIETMLQLAEKLVEETKPIEAIPILVECIEFFQTHMVPPSKDLISAQISLIESYFLITNS